MNEYSQSEKKTQNTIFLNFSDKKRSLNETKLVNKTSISIKMRNKKNNKSLEKAISLKDSKILSDSSTDTKE